MNTYRMMLLFLTCVLVFGFVPRAVEAACYNKDFGANAVFGQPIPTTPYDGWAAVEVRVDGDNDNVDDVVVQRPFCLWIPSTYDGSRDVPLILMFHGGNQSAAAWSSDRQDLLSIVEPEGAVVAFAQGYRFPGDDSLPKDHEWEEHVGGATWNAAHCCDPSFNEEVDDVGYAAAIVEALKTNLMIDSDRVYAFGGSNGGMLVHRLAAERPDLFAAVAVKSATVGGQPSESEPLGEIQPSAALPVLMIHGGRDSNVNYHGGLSEDRWRRDLSFRNSVGLWVWNNECSADPEHLPSASGVRIEKYVDCASNSEVVAVSIQNMGHGWGRGEPPLYQDEINKMIVAFFKRHTQ